MRNMTSSGVAQTRPLTHPFKFRILKIAQTTRGGVRCACPERLPH